MKPKRDAFWEEVQKKPLKKYEQHTREALADILEFGPHLCTSGSANVESSETDLTGS